MTSSEDARLRRYEKRMGFALGKDRVSIRAFPFSSVDVEVWRLVRDPSEMGDGKRWVTIIPNDEDDGR